MVFSGGSLDVGDEDFGFVLGVDTADVGEDLFVLLELLGDIAEAFLFKGFLDRARSSVEMEAGLVVMRAVAFGPVGLGVIEKDPAGSMCVIWVVGGHVDVLELSEMRPSDLCFVSVVMSSSSS